MITIKSIFLKVPLISKVVFFPSFFYTIFMTKVFGRPWYDQIDGTVILGALPLKSFAKKLLQEKDIGGVISLNQDFELKFSYGPKEWKDLGIEFLQLNMADFVGVPTPDQVHCAISMINRHMEQGKFVYVHCKAGRTRSSTLVASYLIQKNLWCPEKAIAYIVSKRSHIRIFDVQREFLWKFYEDLKLQDHNNEQ